jgi:hypothetical protein
MSEDKTEISGNNEPTEELEAQKAPTTTIMLEVILARMNEGFAEINQRFDAVESDSMELRMNCESSENLSALLKDAWMSTHKTC